MRPVTCYGKLLPQISAPVLSGHTRSLSHAPETDFKSQCSLPALGPNTVRQAVVVDGVRTPFVHAGGEYANIKPHQLTADVLRMLMKRVGLSRKLVDHIVVGSVMHDVSTSNVAREGALLAGFPDHVTAHTVTMACISSNRAVAAGAEQIACGQSDVVLCAGVEQMSDPPVRHHPRMRRLLLRAMRARTWREKLELVPEFLDPRIYRPIMPEIVEFSTREHLGHAADRLSASFSVSRREQDDFAYRSHDLARKAFRQQLLTDLQHYHVPRTDRLLTKDVGVDADLRVMREMEPYFVLPHGTVTIGNSSFLTDGAAACLLTSRGKARELGLQPKAAIREYVFTSQDPRDELLMGQVYAIPAVLRRAGLTLNDIDVFELHEAFAGQVLANLKALDSDWYCNNYLGIDRVGEIPLHKLNLLGGTIALGHPFSATGARLVNSAVNRLRREDGRLALVASCASGGQGHAMILERL